MSKYSKEQFEEIYIKNYNFIKFFCTKFRNGNMDYAEDLTQNVFVKAFLNIEKFKSEKASLKTWLCTIAKNECLTFYNSCYNKRTVLVYEPELFYNLPETNNLEEKEVEVKINKIQDILEVLGEYRSEIIRLKYFEGLTSKKVGELLNTNANCVRSETTRIFKFIRNNFNKDIEHVSVRKYNKNRKVLMLEKNKDLKQY